MMVTLPLAGSWSAKERVAMARVSPDKVYKKCLRCMSVTSWIIFDCRIRIGFKASIKTSYDSPCMPDYSGDALKRLHQRLA